MMIDQCLLIWVDPAGVGPLVVQFRSHLGLRAHGLALLDNVFRKRAAHLTKYRKFQLIYYHHLYIKKV